MRKLMIRVSGLVLAVSLSSAGWAGTTAVTGDTNSQLPSLSQAQAQHAGYSELPPESTDLQPLLQDLLPAASQAKVGIYLYDRHNKRAWSLQDEAGYPLMSVFKLPQAVWYLRQVEQGVTSLSSRRHVRRAELLQNTYSPMLTDYIRPEFDVTTQQLLRYSVSLSDNNAVDLLLAESGGVVALQQFLRERGLQQTTIEVNEQQMHQQFSAQYANHTKPSDLALLLEQLAEGQLLTPLHQALLWQWLTETPTGPKRVKAAIPSGSVWRHKTGTSGKADDGTIAAVNDIGLLQLADGRQWLLVMLVKDSHFDYAESEALMAALSQRLITELVQAPVN